MSVHPEDWQVLAQGDADEFALVGNAHRWVIAFRLNGELHAHQQQPIVRLITAAPALQRVAQAALDLLENPDADSFDAARVESELRTVLATFAS